MKIWMSQNIQVADNTRLRCFYSFCFGVLLFVSNNTRGQSPKHSLQIILRNRYYETNNSDTTYIYQIQRGFRKKIKLSAVIIQKGDSIVEEYESDSKKITFQKTQITENRIVKKSETIASNEKDIISPFRSYTLFWKNFGNYILFGADTSGRWQKTDSIARHDISLGFSVDSLFTFKYYSSNRLLSQVNIQKEKESSNHYFYGKDLPAYSVYTSYQNSQFTERWEVPSSKREERLRNDVKSFERTMPVITNYHDLDNLEKDENLVIIPSLLHPHSKWRVDNSFIKLIESFQDKCDKN